MSKVTFKITLTSDPKLPFKVKEKSEKIEKLEKTEKTGEKGTDSSVEEDKGARESDTDIFSPKNTFSQDSNDGSGDERKGEQPWSPEHKAPSSSLKLVSKLVNRPRAPAQPHDNGYSLLSERLKRLLALVGNPNVPVGRAQECSRRRAPPPPPPVFRPPPPIAPRLPTQTARALDLGDVPRMRRGRARVPEQRVIVQRLLPVLPKLPPAPPALIPVKLVPDAPAPPRILPKPPPTSTSDLSFFYVLSESNGQFYFHDGDRRIPITQPNQVETLVIKDEISEDPDDPNTEASGDQPEASGDHPKVSEDSEQASIESSIKASKDASASREASKESVKGEHSTVDNEGRDIGSLLGVESVSLSPARLLRDSECWLEGGAQDFSLSSFLQHLEGRAPPPDLAVDSHLHSLLAESSVDYVAKFADLAAEVTDEVDPPGDLT